MGSPLREASSFPRSCGSQAHLPRCPAHTGHCSRACAHEVLASLLPSCFLPWESKCFVGICRMVSTGLLWKLHLSMITHADCRPPDTKHQLLKSVFMILFYQNTCPGLSSIPSKLFHISPVGSCLGGRDCVCGVAAGVSLNRGYMTRILIPFNRLFDESFPQASLFIP